MPKRDFTLTEIESVAHELINGATSKFLALYGDMGTGKTTLTKSLLKNLGAVDAGNSPTFGLVNEHADSDGNVVAYHFDFYRISSEEEAFDLGLEVYFESGAFILVEWPEKIPNLLPKDKHDVYLYFVDENTRRIEYQGLQTYS